MKWDQVKFRAERGSKSSVCYGGSTTSAPKKQLSLSHDDKTFTYTSGWSGRVDYARVNNPSKGTGSEGKRALKTINTILANGMCQACYKRCLWNLTFSFEYLRSSVKSAPIKGALIFRTKRNSCDADRAMV